MALLLPETFVGISAGHQARQWEEGRSQLLHQPARDTGTPNSTSMVHLFFVTEEALTPTKLGGGSERAMFATEGSFPLWHMATSRRAMKNPWGNTGGQVRHCIKGRVAYPGLQTCLSR